MKLGKEDTLIKIKEGVNEATTELVAIADDDAEYPKDWIENLESAMADDPELAVRQFLAFAASMLAAEA